MSAILVTGAAGFIGSNLCKYLIQHTDYKIIAVDDLSGGYKENLPERSGRFLFFKMGAEDPYLEKAFENEDIQIVYCLHAYAAENLSPFIRKHNYTVNLVSTMNVINLSIKYGVKRFVFTSSIAVYGSAIPPFFERLTSPNPLDPYGLSKLTVEKDLEIAKEQHGLSYVVVRPFNVYGPGQNYQDSFRNVLGIWMKEYRSGKPFTIFGDGEQTRNFTYIDTILKPLMLCGTDQNLDGETFNLGSDTPYSVKNAALILKRVIGDFSIEFNFLPARHEVSIAQCDTRKAVAFLGYEDGVSLEQGIEKMWKWVQENPRTPLPSPPIELERGLYPSWAKKETV